MTEVVFKCLAENNTGSLWLFEGIVKFSGWIKMNRRGRQVRGPGSLLKAAPVFVVGIVVLVIILRVYLELMLTFPW